LRVALIDDSPTAPVDDAIRVRLAELAAWLSRAGVQVRTDWRPVDDEESHATYLHLLRSATGALLDAPTWAAMAQRAAQLPTGQDDTESRTYRASVMSHRDWVSWDQRRERLRRQWAQTFEQFDVVICPVATSLPIHHNHQGQRWERMVMVNGQPQPHTHSLFWAGYPGVVGLPATAFPLGLTPQGLPVGAQIIAAPRHDLLCLGLAEWLESQWQGFTPAPYPM
jgi:amidase